MYKNLETGKEGKKGTSSVAERYLLFPAWRTDETRKDPRSYLWLPGKGQDAGTSFQLGGLDKRSPGEADKGRAGSSRLKRDSKVHCPYSHPAQPSQD